VQLTLQAGALGKGGELFMLDMGEPTEHPKVLRARKETAETWGDHLIDQLIQSAVNGEGPENLRAMLRVIVPDFVSDQPGPMMPTPGFGVPVIADVAPVGKRRNSKPGSSG